MMIPDNTIREAFTRAYQKHRAHPERALPEGVESPCEAIYRHPGLAETRARDRAAQARQDRDRGRAAKPKLIFEYRDKPAGAASLAATLLHYGDFLGPVERYPLEEMAAMALPLCVWQNVFSQASKRAQRKGRLGHPPSYVMDLAKRAARCVRVLPPG